MNKLRKQSCIGTMLVIHHSRYILFKSRRTRRNFNICKTKQKLNWKGGQSCVCLSCLLLLIQFSKQLTITLKKHFESIQQKKRKQKFYCKKGKCSLNIYNTKLRSIC